MLPGHASATIAIRVASDNSWRPSSMTNSAHLPPRRTSGGRTKILHVVGVLAAGHARPLKGVGARRQYPVHDRTIHHRRDSFVVEVANGEYSYYTERIFDGHKFVTVDGANNIRSARVLRPNIYDGQLSSSCAGFAAMASETRRNISLRTPPPRPAATESIQNIVSHRPTTGPPAAYPQRVTLHLARRLTGSRIRHQHRQHGLQVSHR